MRISVQSHRILKQGIQISGELKIRPWGLGIHHGQCIITAKEEDAKFHYNLTRIRENSFTTHKDQKKKK